MSRKELLRLMAGFRRFKEKYFLNESSVYQRLSSSGQTPKTLVIGCSDSRVDPAIITSASPGELFIVRNVANLVPPYETPGLGYHGVSSAIEFAVVSLKVDHIIILGHRQCGGIRSLMLEPKPAHDSFIGHWMQIAQEAKEKVLAENPGESEENLCRSCEMESIVVSLRNLRSFPFVKEALQERGLQIIGAYFDLENGQLFELDEAHKEFRNLEI